MPESVNIVVGAKDEASAKLATMSANVDKFGKTAKAGGKAIQQFNTVLGSTPFGQYAGGLANMAGELIEVKNQLGQAANSSMLFKGALVATAGVIGFQIGNAIRKAIDEISGLNDYLRDAIEKTNELGNAEQARLNRRDRAKQADFAEIENPQEKLAAQKEYLAMLDKEVEAQKLNAKAKQDAVDASNKWYRIDETDKEVEMLKAEADAEKEKLKVLQQQRDAMREQTSQREQERLARKEAAETEKRLDAERRQRADEMWKREAEEHQKQINRQENARKGAGKWRQQLQEWKMEAEEAISKDMEKMRDDAKKKAEEDKKERRSAFDSARAEVLARRNAGAGAAPDIQGFQSRMLSRANRVDPIDKVAKNGELTNKELAEIRKIQQQQLEEQRRANREFESFETVGP